MLPSGMVHCTYLFDVRLQFKKIKKKQHCILLSEDLFTFTNSVDPDEMQHYASVYLDEMQYYASVDPDEMQHYASADSDEMQHYASVDPDEMQHYAAFHLVLHCKCIHFTCLMVSQIQRIKFMMVTCNYTTTVAMLFLCAFKKRDRYIFI